MTADEFNYIVFARADIVLAVRWYIRHLVTSAAMQMEFELIAGVGKGSNHSISRPFFRLIFLPSINSGHGRSSMCPGAGAWRPVNRERGLGPQARGLF